MYELVSQGLRQVSNKIRPRNLSKRQARILNRRLMKAGSMKWLTTELVNQLGFERPDYLLCQN